MPPEPAGAPPAPPTRMDRFRDLLALTLIVSGMVLVFASHIGMRRLATQPIVVAHGEWAISQYMHFRRIELIGYVAAVAGLLAGIWSYVIHAQARVTGGPPTSQV
jgi:hypothetical protein